MCQCEPVSTIYSTRLPAHGVGDRLATVATFGKILFGNMLPDPFPLFVAQPNCS
jgi:hypothetical protein